MGEANGPWSRYENWNAAIAEVVYSPERAGQPVYLDLEEELLESIGKLAEPGSADPMRSLVDAVMGTLHLGLGPRMLYRHLHRLDRWRRGAMVDPPPCLALLALLSLAAENMRQSDGIPSHNFYKRLAELTGLDEGEQRAFEQAYRHRRSEQAVSAELWDALNDWLERMEGTRGLPTAYPIGHEHIGLPMSQALVRQADREKLYEMFASQGLAPRTIVPTREMLLRLDEWMSRVPCPASNALERLWARASTRQAIADVARLELENWDGVPLPSSPALASASVDALRLRAVLRTFPSRDLDLSLLLPGRIHGETEEFLVVDTTLQDCASLDFVPFASGWLASAQPLDAASMLLGNVQLRRPRTGQLLRRRARRLVPLRWDDLLQSYVECERVQLGEQSMVLCHRQIEDQAHAFLYRAARPGFGCLRSFPGLPDGWTLFTGVQILSGQRDPLVDLQTLQPVADSRTVLQGGLRLPGHLPKWSTAQPPELRVSAEGATELEARLACTRPMASPKPADARVRRAGAVLIWDLNEVSLVDGDYELAVLADGLTMGSETVRLRSADNPAREFHEGPERIANEPGAAAFGLLAIPSSSPAAFDVAPAEAGGLRPGTVAAVPEWWNARGSSPVTSGHVEVVAFPRGGHSCIETGAHHMDVATAELGEKTVEGVCRYCGLVKRYPATYRHSSLKPLRAAPLVTVDSMPPVRDDVGIDWRVAFDALCHVGGGSASALDRIAAQMEATDLFGDAFARTLEVCGHIEIERDRVSLQQVTWRVNDPALVGLPNGDAVLVGFRSERGLVAIEDEVWDAGGESTEEPLDSGPSVVRVRGLPDERLHSLAKTMSAAVDRPVRYLADAAARLAACLPSLSEAVKGLPVTSALTARSYERWDPRTAQFERTTDASATGAFRLTGHGRLYVYRRGEDIGTVNAVLGDARIVKYLAALDASRPLTGYDAEAQILYVPLGADLPGLYGRAAVLASGRPPRKDPDQRLLTYHSVTPALAAHLAHLLSS